MAHNLSFVGGKAQFAYASNIENTPWHSFGQVVAPGSTPEVWAEAGLLNFSIDKGAVRYYDGKGNLREFADKICLYRSDNGAAMSIVSSKYNVLQPVDMLRDMYNLAQHYNAEIHTVGILDGGRKQWALAKFGEQRGIDAKDMIAQYLLLATSCDGTLKNTLKPTAVCVVCENTQTAALGDGLSMLTYSHRQKFDTKRVKRDLASLYQCFDTYIENADKLAGTKMTDQEAKEILTLLFAKPVKAAEPEKIVVTPTGNPFADILAKAELSAGKLPELTPSGREKKEPRAIQECLQLFQGAGMGSDLSSRRGTSWGLLNAVTEFVDHHRQSHSDNNRLDSAWFGAGDAIKTSAFEELIRRAA